MEITRIFDILDRYLEKFPNQDAALACKRDGEWKKFSIQEYVELTNLMSYGMMALGVKKGDNIGIVSGNRPEWNMLDFAVMQIGAVSVPIYPTISQEDYRHILNHAGMRMIFIEGKDLRSRLEPILPTVTTLEDIFTFNQENSKYRILDQLIELGRQKPQPEELTKIKASIKPEELATIIYTSGTTGTQKGVMLSHSNIVNQLLSLKVTPAE